MLKVRIFRLPSCLTGGLCVSATAYYMWNGRNRNNSKEWSQAGIAIIRQIFAAAGLGSVVPYQLVNKDLRHCFNCCQLEVPYWKSDQPNYLIYSYIIFTQNHTLQGWGDSSTLRHYATMSTIRSHLWILNPASSSSSSASWASLASCGVILVLSSQQQCNRM